MMQTTCKLDGNHWVINGRKRFITGAEGAKVGIVMAKSEDGACMFLVDLPDPAIRTVRDATRRPLIAAGGVTTQAEIDELDALGIDAVVGMAIYTGKLKLDPRSA